MDLLLKKEILNTLKLLPSEDQEKVLDFTRVLLEKRMMGRQGKDLLFFAGSWEKSELDSMMKAIEDDCERVDIHEW